MTENKEEIRLTLWERIAVQQQEILERGREE